jgi:integrase
MAQVWRVLHKGVGMARPGKNTSIDLTVTHELSVGLIERLTCPAGATKAFLRDKDVSGLRVRVTSTGVKAFVFEAKLNGKAISRTLGGFPLMSISDAKDKARDLAKTIKTDKQDPRELDKQAEAKADAAATAAALKIASAKVEGMTIGEVWAVYVEERRPHWGELYYQEHFKKTTPGGTPYKRGKGITVAGPLFPMMAIPLRELTSEMVEAWAEHEAKSRPTSARLGWRMLKVFLGWCEEQKAYAALMPAKNPAKTKKSREHLGRVNKRKDALQREQLPAWFDAVQKLDNSCVSAYLQIMLLTGARPGEIITMQWKNISTQWKSITIKDKINKVTRERTIPLPPYIAHLLSTLPKRSEWVFSSPTSATGHITEPNHANDRACAVAGIDELTLHGLRRSFKSASEWLDIPNGVRQNIMGHVAKSTDEDYTIRPLDLLRLHHEKIEAWILEQAGIVFDAKAAPGALRVVQTA